MDVNNVLRLALILSNNQASTFKTNLKKIIKLVLTDSYPNSMTSYEISSYISSNYSLDFANTEIENCLNNDDSTNKEIVDGIFRYRLTPKEYQKYKEKENSNLDRLLSEFLEEYDADKEITFTECKDIIFRFFYYTFNNDVHTLLLLLNNKSTNQQDYCNNDNFDCEEAKLINEFLGWNNREKNELILNIISSCYDYCMLTVKKDNRSYATIFNGKTFYLDSNVIFRLAGFNKKERQEVMQAFIRKCEDAGIKIKYTNFTKEEIKSTIKHNVHILSSIMKDSAPIAPKAVNTLDSRFQSFDFYEIYFEWTVELNNQPGDFKSFERYLNKKVENCCKSFCLETFDSFDTVSNRESFTNKCNDFSEFKRNKYRETNDTAIKTDINNYLFLIGKNKDGQANSFLDLNSFFITADHCLTEWALQVRPGSIPIFVLPSIWYSILLKYKGRTDNDYEAFCKFLNIRIAPEKDVLYYNKKVMLAKVLSLPESREIKEEIIFDIESKLNEIGVDDAPEEVVNNSIESVTQKYVDEAVKKATDEHEKQLNELYEMSETQINKKYNEGKNRGYELGKIEERDRILKKETKRIIRRNKIINSILLFGCFFFFIILIAVILTTVFTQSSEENTFLVWLNNNSVVVSIVDSLLVASCAVLKYIFSKIDPLSEKYEIIYKRLEYKYDK